MTPNVPAGPTLSGLWELLLSPFDDADFIVLSDDDDDGEGEGRTYAQADPFWSACSSEFQLRDRLTGVLHERGWVVANEHQMPYSWGRADILAFGPDDQRVLVEVKLAIATSAELRAGLMQAGAYRAIWLHCWPDQPIDVYLVAGSLRCYQDEWGQALGVTPTTAEEFIMDCGTTIKGR